LGRSEPVVTLKRMPFAPEVERYRSELTSIFRDKRIIVVGGPVAGLAPLAVQLRELGAERPFIIGSSLGTGDLPTEDQADWVSLEVSAGSALQAIHHYEDQLTHLPDVVRRRLDAYDPSRSAIALGAIVLGDVPSVAGRPRYAARPRSWAALEDKVTIDELWDAIEVPRAASEIVPAVETPLREASARLDDGLGTVWAADARDGITGGAEELRWIRSDDDVQPAVAHFSTRCDRVRVMPFLNGIPCSIHGIVLPDGVAVFRPAELIVLRRPIGADGACRFCYAGVATFWDPPPADREQMREVARIAARALATRVGFRGAFTIDGVLTERGFLPTELNPRVGAGLGVLGRSVPGLPLVLLALAAQAGETLDFRPAELEQLVVTGADARRAGGGWLAVSGSGRRPETRRWPLVETNGGYRVSAEGEPEHAELVVGPSDVGSFVRFTPDPSRIRPGVSIASRVVHAFELADRLVGTAIGGLEAAPPAAAL
jgi:hypothetical protein